MIVNLKILIDIKIIWYIILPYTITNTYTYTYNYVINFS